MQSQVLSSVYERDIDLLLVEEIQCSASFRRWLAGRLRHAIGHEIGNWTWRVRHSVSSSGSGSGETDIEVIAVPPDTDLANAICLMFENKLDAPFSDRVASGETQIQRYRKRMASAIASGRCCRAIGVLVAPEQYLRSTTERLDAALTYEEIAAALDQMANDVAMEEHAIRARHRAATLRLAASKQQRGWTATPVAEVTDTWRLYYQIATREFPQLRMRDPGAKPGDSYTVAFTGVLPPMSGQKACRIEHVMERGYVFVLVPGQAHQVDRLSRTIGSSLPSGAYLCGRGKALGICLDVPLIRTLEPPAKQQGAIRAGLRAANQLREWFYGHHVLLAESLREQAC